MKSLKVSEQDAKSSRDCPQFRMSSSSGDINPTYQREVQKGIHYEKHKPQKKNTVGWSQLGFPEFITVESSTKSSTQDSSWWEAASGSKSLGSQWTPQWVPAVQTPQHEGREKKHLGKQVKETVCGGKATLNLNLIIR